MADPAPPRARVLVIDDEVSLRHALAKGLTRLGYLAEDAATGKAGVDRFVGGGYDAVLTDLKLPDISGLDIVAILTEMDPDVPVVVMTGYGTVDTALEAMRRGAKDYVQKPFAVEDVVRVLERAIAERRLSAENRRLRALVERRFAPGEYEKVDEELKAIRADGAAAPADAPEPAGSNGPLPLRDAQRQFEVRYVQELLARSGGNVAGAARLAGISRPNFHKKLRTLGVDPAPFKRAARRGRAGDF
jgi:DNA-binding NtrC family response regulator